MNNKMITKKTNRKTNKKILALTLGLGLAMGSLTGSYTIAQANQKPAEIQNMQTGHEKPMFDKADHQDLLILLKIDEQAFKQDVDSGMSLTEIAGSYHVSRQAVVKVAIKNINKQIDKSLADKRISVEQANEMKSNVVADVQKMVDMKPIAFDNTNDQQTPQGVNDQQTPQGMNDKQAPQGVNDKQTPQGVNDKQNSQGVNDKQAPQDAQSKQNLQDMLTLLKIDEQTFAQEQSSGKSLAEIAAAHNVPRQAVVDLVTKDMNQQIDTGLAEKRITVEQANEMKTNATQKVQEVVDRNMIEQPAQPQK